MKLIKIPASRRLDRTIDTWINPFNVNIIRSWEGDYYKTKVFLNNGGAVVIKGNVEDVIKEFFK